MYSFKPFFVGFPSSPGTYSAVTDLRDVEMDEDGTLHLPFYYDPSGNGPLSVTVGVK